MKRIIFNLALKVIAKTLRNSDSTLKASTLIEKGWIIEHKHGKRVLVEPNIKDRDKVYVEFEKHYYRVWHGRDMTFIALHSRAEWFETYMLLIRENA